MKNITRLFRFTILAMVIFYVVGCASAPKSPMAATETRCIGSYPDYQVMEVAENVIADMQFTIEKFDVEQGYLSTRPLTGAQLFELWRSDTRGFYNTAASNIHTIQRVVELELKGTGGSSCIDCRVYLKRLSAPPMKVASRGELASRYGEGLGFEEEQMARMEWVDMGRDGNLEKYIIDKIESKLQKI
jgi:hypothetical protein